MRRLFPLGLALALALPLFSLTLTRPATAAGEPKALATADGKDVAAFSWADTADGKVGINDKLAAAISDLFAGTVWVVMDDGSLGVGRVKDGKVDLVFIAFHKPLDDKGTRILFHERDGNLIFDGTLNRDSQDPSRGYAELTMMILGDNGQSSTSTYIHQELQFRKQ